MSRHGLKSTRPCSVKGRWSGLRNGRQCDPNLSEDGYGTTMLTGSVSLREARAAPFPEIMTNRGSTNWGSPAAAIEGEASRRGSVDCKAGRTTGHESAPVVTRGKMLCAVSRSASELAHTVGGAAQERNRMHGGEILSAAPARPFFGERSFSVPFLVLIGRCL